MKTSDLVFIGIKGSVIALNRATGQQVWATHLKGSDFVHIVLENDQILASTAGEIFSLSPLTGEGLWHNPLKGFGTGLATMATTANPGNGITAAVAEQHRRNQEASASGAGASTTAANMS